MVRAALAAPSASTGPIAMGNYQLGKLVVVGGVLLVVLVAALFAVWLRIPDLPPVGPVASANADAFRHDAL